MVTDQSYKNEVSLLREVNLFHVFTDLELNQLAKMGEQKSYESYANIVIEGELSWGIFLILRGTVGIFKNGQSKNTLYDIGHLQQGSFFGEMSLVDENPRSATVRALTQTTLFCISKEAFNLFLNQSKDRKLRFYESCSQQLVARLRILNDSYVISQYQLWKTALNKDKKEIA